MAGTLKKPSQKIKMGGFLYDKNKKA